MRRLILNLICSIGLAANFCLAAQDDAGKNFEFKNSHVAGEDIRLSGKPWKEDEKDLILKIISAIQEKSQSKQHYLWLTFPLTITQKTSFPF